MPSTQYLKDKILNLARGTAFAAYTSYMSFATSKPDFAASTATELGYTGFARQAQTMGAPSTVSGFTRRSASTAVATFPTMAAGAGGYVGYGLEYDAITAGNILRANPLPDVGSALSITAASNAGPIVITTSAAHNLATNQFVRVAGVTGNTAANDNWQITVLTSTTFSLNGSTGNGAYVSGGTAQPFGFMVQNGVTPSIAIGNFYSDVAD